MAIEDAEKNAKCYLDPELIEIVFKGVSFNHLGEQIANPKLLLVPGQKLETLSPTITQNSDLTSFLSHIANIRLSDTMKTRAIFVILYTSKFFYSIFKWQNEAVPGFIITSEDPEAQKTTMARITLTTFH